MTAWMAQTVLQSATEPINGLVSCAHALEAIEKASKRKKNGTMHAPKRGKAKKTAVPCFRYTIPVFDPSDMNLL